MSTLVFIARIVAEVPAEMEGQYTAHLLKDLIGLDTRGCPGFEVATIAVERHSVTAEACNICPECFGSFDLPYLYPDENGACHGTGMVPIGFSG